ncbi:hypothetical protein NKH18_34150 [Streptomyces sp. M10(2022)]
MDTYLENHPELQLKDKSGAASPPGSTSPGPRHWSTTPRWSTRRWRCGAATSGTWARTST